MADAEAEVRMLLTTREATASMRKWQREMTGGVDEVEKKTGRAGMVAKSAGKSYDSWATSIGRAATRAVGFLGTIQSIRTVANLVSRELERIQEIQKEAKGIQLPFEGEMQRMASLLAIPQTGRRIDTPEVREAIRTHGKGIDPAVLAGAVSAAISSEPGGDKRRAVETALEVARLRPDVAERDPENLKLLAAATVAQQRSFGGSVESTLGMLAAGESAAQTTDADAFLKNIASAAPKMKVGQFTQQGALAMLAGLGSAGFDVEGSTTATGALNLRAQVFEKIQQSRAAGLDVPEELPGLDVFRFVAQTGKFKGVSSQAAKQIRDEMLGVMQEGLSEGELKQIIDMEGGRRGAGELTGRAKQLVQMRQFLQEGGGLALQLTEDALKAMPSSQAAAADLLRERQEGIMATPSGRAMEADRATRAAKIEGLTDPQQMLRASTMEAIDDLLQRSTTTETVLTKQLLMLREKFRQGTATTESEETQRLISFLRSRKNRLESRNQDLEDADANILDEFGQMGTGPAGRRISRESHLKAFRAVLPMFAAMFDRGAMFPISGMTPESRAEEVRQNTEMLRAIERHLATLVTLSNQPTGDPTSPPPARALGNQRGDQ